jgi:hypothetical protein
MMGLTVDTLNNQTFNRFTICVADPQGVKLFEKRYGRKTFQYLDKQGYSRSAFLKDASGFYVSVNVLDSNNKYFSALIRFNFNGDTLWQKKYYDTGSDNLYMFDIAKTVDNALIFTGIFSSSPDKILLIKTDLLGNELWRKKLQNNPVTNGWSASRIVQDSASKKFVIAGYKEVGSNINDLILFTDSLGNFPQAFSFFGSGTDASYGDLIQLKNHNFIAVGGKQISASPMKWRSAVACFNPSASLVWSKYLDSAALTNGFGSACLLNDGTFILGGAIDTTCVNFSPLRTRLVMVRPDGSIKWKRYYRTLNTNYSYGEYQTSLNLTQSGGFLASTSFPYKPSPAPYSIYKIDSTGCDSTVQYCQSLIGVQEFTLRNVLVKIWPNPANEKLFLVAQNGYVEASKIRISSAIGQLVFESEFSNEIDISKFPSGIYLLKLFNETSQEVVKFVKE